ncbi:hypothetical protein ACHAW5_003102 [Stephanodiscus triporus]|uniref:Uncharacterized protein n=1 Tax=Stephanodiscus triporus TaxID=2934178 RepID=A0ABD3MC32_9STRA
MAEGIEYAIVLDSSASNSERGGALGSMAGSTAEGGAASSLPTRATSAGRKTGADDDPNVVGGGSGLAPDNSLMKLSREARSSPLPSQPPSSPLLPPPSPLQYIPREISVAVSSNDTLCVLLAGASPNTDCQNPIVRAPLVRPEHRVSEPADRPSPDIYYLKPHRNKIVRP